MNDSPSTRSITSRRKAQATILLVLDLESPEWAQIEALERLTGENRAEYETE